MQGFSSDRQTHPEREVSTVILGFISLQVQKLRLQKLYHFTKLMNLEIQPQDYMTSELSLSSLEVGGGDQVVLRQEATKDTVKGGGCGPGSSDWLLPPNPMHT